MDIKVKSMTDIDAAFKLPSQLISSCAKAFVKCFPKLPKLLAQIIKLKRKSKPFIWSVRHPGRI